MALKYSTTFVLMQTKVKNKPTSLRCYVRYNNKRAAFLTDVKVEPRYFNKEKQRADENSRFNGYDINQRLEEILRFISTRFSEYKEFPDTKEFASVCQSFVSSGEVFTKDDANDSGYPRTLLKYIQRLAEDSRSGRRLIARGARKGQRYRPDSINSYDSVVAMLEKYMMYTNREDLPLSKIDEEFFNGFADFFFNELGHAVSYFTVPVKIIKMALLDASDRFQDSRLNTLAKRLIKPNYESDTIYLDIDKLKILSNHNFSSSEHHLDNARDLFLVGCWTGLRYSDFSTLTKDDIQSDYIRVKMEKTSERVAIPLHPMLRKVIEKNNGTLPRSISNQRLNDYIKLAAQRAGLIHEVRVRRNVGGVDKEEVQPFYQLITTHTARRSFATNMFKKGIPTLLIMAITGHKTEAAFLKYIRVSNEEKAAMMAELWKKIDWD